MGQENKNHAEAQSIQAQAFGIFCVGGTRKKKVDSVFVTVTGKRVFN